MNKRFKLTKLNIVTLAIVACIAVIIAAAGGSIAYFTDAKEATNVFTAGNVYISLTEAAVVNDGTGNLVADPSGARFEGSALDDTTATAHDYGALYPGKTMHKDPTITNTGDDPAYIAAKIIIEDGNGDIRKLYGYPDMNIDLISIRNELLFGGLIGESAHYGTWNGHTDAVYNDQYAMLHTANAADGKYEFYIFLKAPLAKGESVVLFDTMTVDPSFGNTEMKELSDLKITVQAFAVQQFGFSSSYEAMGAAFSTHFPMAATSGQ